MTNTKPTVDSSQGRFGIPPSYWVVVAILGAILLCWGNLWLSWNPFVLWKSQQITLASQWNVEISDFPSRAYFPVGYFERQLRPGTPIAQVHSLVQGYAKAYKCSGNREVYYYFSFYDNWALRFEIWYDADMRVQAIQGEDEDSRSIQVNGCMYGLLSDGI